MLSSLYAKSLRTVGLKCIFRKSSVILATLPLSFVKHHFHFIVVSRAQLFHLEEKRKQRMHDLAVIIQKTFRGWKARTTVSQLNPTEKRVEFHYWNYVFRWQ